MIALEAQELCKGVSLPAGGHLELVRSVSFQVRAGETVAIVGRSGSGKTTLLTLLGLLSPADSGRVVVQGRDSAEMSDRELSALRNEQIGFVFQNYSLLGHLNAAENVALPMRHGARLPRAEVSRRTEAALTLVGLSDRARSRPQHLSGGEQQRVAIARALVRAPSVILADEPTGALDTTTAEQVLNTLIDATRSTGAALAVVTHDPVVASRMDRMLRLESGALTDERQAECVSSPKL